MDWSTEVVAVLHKLGRSALGVTPMPKPTMGGNGMGSPRAPTIIVYFSNKAELASTLGPIKVFSFETEILRFTADE